MPSVDYVFKIAVFYSMQSFTKLTTLLGQRIKIFRAYTIICKLNNQSMAT